MVASSAPSIGHCNTMGTASSMNSVAEALGMSLTGCAVIPAPYKEREQISFETGKRPTAMLDRNLSYLSLVEVLYGYPIDGVILTTGCDKTTPAALMAAATVNIPAIVLSGGPMLD